MFFDIGLKGSQVCTDECLNRCFVDSNCGVVHSRLFYTTPPLFFLLVHFCTDFTSTANATVSTYGRDVLRRGTLLQAVRVLQDSHLLNTHPYPQPTRATKPNRHSFAGNIQHCCFNYINKNLLTSSY
ncbi:hypothetical protein RF11_09966 [Thelohanellus kitauei]|uniref:Uncharacterized protein n=1 Tax=Thelohanellus kitauei TaxID=669202 RepID=A0A0C2JN07_THEKT|nr:hypothetical protein RF11_09966 [Thelohanellus kitauei]